MPKWKYILIAGSLVFAGCSPRTGGGVSGELAQTPPAMFQLNDLLHASAAANGHPATQLSDLDRKRSLFPLGYKAVKDGDIIVVWGIRPKGEGQIAKGEEQVVAYEKVAPKEGGYVLFSGGTIKKMSATEFAAALKAGKSSR